MSDEDPRFAFDLGQPVRRTTDATGRVGYVVAVMLNDPYLALVRWRHDEPTFEPLDDLVEVVPPRVF